MGEVLALARLRGAMLVLPSNVVLGVELDKEGNTMDDPIEEVAVAEASSITGGFGMLRLPLRVPQVGNFHLDPEETGDSPPPEVVTPAVIRSLSRSLFRIMDSFPAVSSLDSIFFNKSRSFWYTKKDRWRVICSSR
jgi:hypothetical protein